MLLSSTARLPLASIAARVARPDVVDKPRSAAEKIAFRERHLIAYQGKRLARRYRRFLDGIEDESVRLAVAEGYHKLLAYKDEYEVGRLLAQTRGKVAEAFGGTHQLTYHLAPPILGGEVDGRPRKRAFGPWVERIYPLLARGKVLRGTPFDPFGYSAERRMERKLIRQYEDDMKEALPHASDMPAAVEALARLPLDIRGFGPVKQANAARVAARREEILMQIRSGDLPHAQAAE